MKYSIIVPIYKVENYLEKCIESIVNQSYRNIEIILVDDGSPYKCPQICDEWAEKDSRIKVIHKNNEGLIAARKSGLKAATGDYVCFVDGDDWIEENMYECINVAVENYQPDCVITQFCYSFSDRDEKSDYNLHKEFYSREDLMTEVFPTMLFKDRFYQFGIYPCCWTKVFKKELLERHIYNVDDRIRLGEDIAFTYPCLMECNSLAFIDEPLYHYRQNPESMTASYDPLLVDIYHLPYETIRDSSLNIDVDLSNQLPYYLLYLTNFVIRNEASTDNPKSNLEKKGVLRRLLDYKFIKNELDLINDSLLPLHTRLLYFSYGKSSYQHNCSCL